MRFNPLLAQRLAEERVKDALRKAEQARLIRAAKGPQEGAGMAAASGADPWQSVGPRHSTVRPYWG